MNRRDFIEKGTAAFLAAQLAGTELFAACTGSAQNSMSKQGINNQGNNNPGTESDPTVLKVRFLGTGAADWTSAVYHGEHRNFSSILVDDRILIDYTAMALSMIPSGIKPETIFYTHSHGDHFNAVDALQLGIRKVYVGLTWYATAKEKFDEAAKSTGKPAPVMIGVDMFTPYQIDGITFIPLPANHGTSIRKEQALIYLMEKGNARVLYATDTGGIMASGAQYAGFDKASSNPRALTGMIMEATMGLDHDEDFRIFTHSSVKTVLRIAHVLQDTGLYKPKNGEPIYLTHLARTLHAPQSELVRTIPAPLAPAYDGLEVKYSIA